MKKNLLAGISALALAGATFTGCKVMEDFEYKVTPSPLEMHGDSVKVTITATVPEKGLHKKAVAEITPYIGETPLKTVIYQGEKAAGNGKVIPYKTGGRISYSDVVAYKPAMENTDLIVKIHATKGKKELDAEENIAKATIITPYLLMDDDKVIMAEDNFVRVTQHDTSAIINYQKNRSNVRRSELREDDIDALKSFVEGSMEEDSRIDIKNGVVDAYASPEGEMSFNSELADERAETGSKAYMSIMEDLEFEKGASEDFYTSNGNGEDWEGFKEELQNADLGDKNSDKDLIIRILSQYPAGAKREEEIRNLAKTYKVIEKKVLPQLRRATLTLNYDLNGKTDDELKELAMNNPDSLTLEEMLFAATLFDDLDTKLKIYRKADENFGSDDWRPANNVGYILYLQNKVDEAGKSFEKAAQVEETNIVKNNLAAVTRINGDRDKAMALLEEASGAGDEVDYNMGLIKVQNGMYGDAVKKMGDYKTFNKALAQVLAGDLSGAMSTIDGSEDAETAYGYYLKAIIGAREEKKNTVINNLKSAIAKDSSLKEKAANDLEFMAYFEDEGFKAAIN